MSQVNFLPSAPVPTGTLQSSAAASDAASVTINQIPRKWSDSNTLVAFIYSWDPSSAPTLGSLPTGWTSLQSLSTASALANGYLSAQLCIFHVSGAAPSSFTFTTSGTTIAVGILEYEGLLVVDGTSIFEGSVTTIQTSTPTNVASINTSGGANRDVLVFGFGTAATGFTSQWPPGVYTQEVHLEIANNTQVGAFSMLDALQTPPGASGNFKIDLNQSDVWIWLAAALKTQ